MVAGPERVRSRLIELLLADIGDRCSLQFACDINAGVKYVCAVWEMNSNRWLFLTRRIDTKLVSWLIGVW